MRRNLAKLICVNIFAVLACVVANAQNTQIERVFVLFKTHLDVGFTDLSSVVEKRYAQEFIPKAIDVAEKLQSDGSGERYVWTTGSWLIHEYLKKASPENIKRLEAAIERGDIVWNAVPYTYESETFSKELFDISLTLSQKLDKKYSKKTVAAKMTDVPGHTRSIVPLLSKIGVEMLHVGVNSATPIPDVPDFCLWKDVQSGTDIILMYQKDYGTESVLPDNKSVVSVNFTGDNHGPHPYEQVKKIYADLRKKYPNATITGGSFNDVARLLSAARDELPVVSSEIGDTWIYGYGSAPLRMARFREVQRLVGEWIKQGKLDPKSDMVLDFALRIGLVAEHTQGCDVKTHLGNWDKYDMDKFNAARTTPPFKKMEMSWREIDNYIDSALLLLPQPLRKEANERLAAVENPKIPVLSNPAKCNKPSEFQLQLKGTKINITPIVYNLYDAKDYELYLNKYMRTKPGWAFDDLGKTGLDKTKAVSATLRTKTIEEQTVKESKGIRTISRLKILNDKGVDDRVMPQDIYLDCFHYNNRLMADIEITIVGKPAVRLPESYWISFVPENIKGVVAEKMGERVDLTDVVSRGARIMNGIDRYVDIKSGKSVVRIWSKDAFLMNLGEARGVNYSEEKPDISSGVHFNLSNNLWGTNFSMWNEGTVKYRFRVEVLSADRVF